MSNEYNESSIEVKEGLEAVRARPGMYIGDSGIDGLHHLIWEIGDNSVDEHMEGHCSEINFKINSNGSFTVIDNGRGIPVGIHPTEGISTATVIFTILHAGGKFDGSSYKTSGGLHGVGASVTNALSEYLEVEIKRDGKVWFQRFEKGKPVADLKSIGDCDSKETSTKVTFKPDASIFKETTTFEDERVTNRLKEISYLNKGLKLTFESELSDKKKTFFSKNGLVDYMKEICPTPIYTPIQIETDYKVGDQIVQVNAIMAHGTDFKNHTISFANNIITTEGGTHVIGSINGFTKSLMDKKDLLKVKDGDKVKAENFKDGLYSIITVKLGEPEFRGQTKGKLNNQEARTATYNAVKEHMEEWIDRNEKIVKEIIKKAVYAKKAQEAMSRAYDLIERKSQLGDGFMLPGKLSDCQSKNPKECELFLIEGDSAGGCFFPTQGVLLADGRTLEIAKLAKEFDNGVDNFIYTFNKKTKLIELQKIVNCWETKRVKNGIRITLDNGEVIESTTNHRFMLKNDSYLEAKDLSIGQSLKPLYTKKSIKGENKHMITGYEYVVQENGSLDYTHHLADNYNQLKEKQLFESRYSRHHIDFNKSNNNPSNLTRMDYIEHIKYHQEHCSKTLHTPEVRARVKETMATPESKSKRSQISKDQWTEEYKENFGNAHNKKNRQDQIANGINLGFGDYWEKDENKESQSKRVKQNFIDNPNRKFEMSEVSKKQWDNKELLAWRSEQTRIQMSNPENIEQANISRTKTRIEKSLSLLNSCGFEKYEESRLKNTKLVFTMDSLISKINLNLDSNISSKEDLELSNHYTYNHKIAKIEFFDCEETPVYDIEVPKTHNFALAAGIFVHNSAKQARNRRTQAVLPLKGKPLNAHKNSSAKTLSNEEVQSIIKGLGSGYKENSDLEKLRYHKVIIMTDADVDGSHIQTLLLGYFFNYHEPLIEAGHLYVAQPPLYYANVRKVKHYIASDNDLVEFKKNNPSVQNIQRFKGLGEMNPEQLEETTMDPEKRILKQVTIDNKEEIMGILDMLLGDDLEGRREFIYENSQFANIDL